MKNFLIKNKKYIFFAFTLIQLALFVAFVTLEFILSKEQIVIKYSGILLCLATAVISIPVDGNDGAAVSLAFLFTAISDFFIFVLNDFYEVGVSTFIVVQLIYFVRINLTHGAKPYISIAVRLALIAGTLLTLEFTASLPPLAVLASIYFPMLVCNAAESVWLFKKSKRYILFFIGLLLFIGCDICVGLYNFTQIGIRLPHELINFVQKAIWIFYFPSQVLIVLSIRKAEYRPFFINYLGADTCEECDE